MTKHVIPILHFGYGDTIDRIRTGYIRRTIRVKSFESSDPQYDDVAMMIEAHSHLQPDVSAQDYIDWLQEHCPSAKFVFRLGVHSEHLHLELSDDNEALAHRMRWKAEKPAYT